jgi:hypothetical protein
LACHSIELRVWKLPYFCAFSVSGLALFSHTYTHTYGLEVFLIFFALDGSSVEDIHKYTSVLGQIDDLVETTAFMQPTPQ